MSRRVGYLTVDQDLMEILNKKYAKDYDLERFPFECGSGWYAILDSLFFQLRMIIAMSPKPIKIRITQIKEKFGELCFYYFIEGKYSPEVQARIAATVHMTERLSSRMCEECGATQNIGHTRGWVRTLCAECASILNYSNFQLLEEKI